MFSVWQRSDTGGLISTWTSTSWDAAPRFRAKWGSGSDPVPQVRSAIDYIVLKCSVRMYRGTERNCWQQPQVFNQGSTNQKHLISFISSHILINNHKCLMKILVSVLHWYMSHTDPCDILVSHILGRLNYQFDFHVSILRGTVITPKCLDYSRLQSSCGMFVPVCLLQHRIAVMFTKYIKKYNNQCQIVLLNGTNTTHLFWLHFTVCNKNAFPMWVV